MVTNKTSGSDEQSKDAQNLNALPQHNLKDTYIPAAIDIDLEAEYWSQLLTIVEHQIQKSNFSTTMHKRADSNLKEPAHEIVLSGEDLWAKVKDLKKNIFHEIKITFPLFDEYSTITKCSCQMDRYLLEEKMCDHILCALKILKFNLDKKTPGSGEERQNWDFLFQSIEKAFQPDKSVMSEHDEPKQIQWLLSIENELMLQPFIKTKTEKIKAEIDDLKLLDPTIDGNYHDWQLIHLIGNQTNNFQLKKINQLHILKNIDHLYLDSFDKKKITVKEIPPNIRIDKSEQGYTARLIFANSQPEKIYTNISGCIAFFDLCKNELYYHETSQSEKDFYQSLLLQIKPIPLAEKDKLIDYLMKIERKIPVAIKEDLELKHQQADLISIIVRITPFNEKGFRVDLFVKPNGITPYPPGIGPQNVLSKADDGSPFSLVRDFDMEIELMREVVESSSLRELYSSSGNYFYAQTEQQILKTIHSFSASNKLKKIIKIEWPKHFGKNYEIINADEQNFKMSATISAGESNLFEIDGTIEIDGEILKLKELIDQIRDQKRYIELPSSNWLYITRELEKKILELANSCNPNEQNESNANDKLDLASTIMLHELARKSDFIDIKYKNKRLKKMLENINSVKTTSFTTSDSLCANLRPYQSEGYSWLMKNYTLGFGCILADDMGLGKTLQAIATLDKTKENGHSLVIVPTSLISNWLEEISKFAPKLKAFSINQFTDKKAALRGIETQNVVITSYGIAVNHREHLEQIHWNCLILDEAQTVKNHSTQTAQEIAKIPARWRLGLSGTPIENNLAELWSMFRVLSPGLLSSFSTFRKRFILPIEKTGDQSKKETLKKIIAPFVLRRLKTDLLKELPPKIETIKFIALKEKERKFYEAARLEAKERIEKKKKQLAQRLEDQGLEQKQIEKQVKNETRFDVLGTLMNLRQIAINPALVDPEWNESSSKNEFLLNSIEELCKSNHKILIFSQFTRQLKILNNESLKIGLSTLYLDGATQATERGELVKKFQAGKADVFFISLKAGGTGLNLTRADYVFHVDPWWNPAAEDQASDRAYRMGQTKTVNVVKLISQNTVEEKITKLHKKKKALANSILEGSDIPKGFDIENYFELI